jgi:hypothetical protein
LSCQGDEKNMTLNLSHLERRITELETLADEVFDLGQRMSRGRDVQPDLSVKGQRWYRGARAIMVQQRFSGLKEFDSCYQYIDARGVRLCIDIESYINREYREFKNLTEGEKKNIFGNFSSSFQKARSLLISLADEVRSRELPIKTELSFGVSENEFETAKEIFDRYNNEDVLIRVSGIVARVALERHMRTVADTRNIVIVRNPPNKPNDGFTDITNSLKNNGVITTHQKEELDLLYRTGNNCAHPKETVVASDVKQLIERGRELASMIL